MGCLNTRMNAAVPTDASASRPILSSQIPIASGNHASAPLGYQPNERNTESTIEPANRENGASIQIMAAIVRAIWIDTTNINARIAATRSRDQVDLDRAMVKPVAKHATMIACCKTWRLRLGDVTSCLTPMEINSPQRSPKRGAMPCLPTLDSILFIRLIEILREGRTWLNLRSLEIPSKVPLA